MSPRLKTTVPSAADYSYITTYEQLREVARKLEGCSAALDIETTHLDPATGSIRLIQICSDEVRLVIDAWKVPNPWERGTEYWPFFTTWVAFNAQFEYAWLKHHGCRVIYIQDVAHARRALEGGDQLSLQAMCAKDLGVDISKSLQTSTWGSPVLSKEQLDYAYQDAAVTWQLHKHWYPRLEADVAAQRREAYGSRDAMKACAHFDSLIPICHDMTQTGVKVDVQEHTRLIESWDAEIVRLEHYIRARIPETAVPNINSNKQLSAHFTKMFQGTDIYNMWPRTASGSDLKFSQAGVEEVLGRLPSASGVLQDTLRALLQLRTYSQYKKLYGVSLLKYLDEHNVLHPRYHIAAAITGRMTCSKPNLQQYPRDKLVAGTSTHFRKIIQSPVGKLIVYDYSSIELRILALLSEDAQLLHDCIYGDVHVSIAESLAGHKLDLSLPAHKELRTAAKGVSFGAVYGVTANGLVLLSGMSHADAVRALNNWEMRYPAAFRFRHRVKAELAQKPKGYIRTIDGGTIYMGSYSPITKCANYPVQRAALAVLTRALIRLDRKFKKVKRDRKEDIPKILAAIHDSIMAGSPEPYVHATAALVREAMELGFTDVFPGASVERLLEGGYGDNWSDLVAIPD